MNAVGVLNCPRCHRANPPEALFCYFDGVALRQSANGRSGSPALLPREFFFPSGRRCRSFLDLAQACQEEWECARALLLQGAFGQFFASVGRHDLACQSQEALKENDPDRALAVFLAVLPCQTTPVPKLDLSPRRIHLETLQAGERRTVVVRIENRGQGLLQGTLSVVDGGNWLRLADGSGPTCPVRAAQNQEVVLLVDTGGLAAPQACAAKLTVITNGGTTEVPVRVDVAVNPFAQPPFHGVSSPRDLAERMRSQPQAAVPLLEDGTILAWFHANGWNYPVQGLPARGIAAVQQFYEGMGLSRPPLVQLSEQRIHLIRTADRTLTGQVFLRTTAKKWVYAHVEGEVSWLRPVDARVSGPQQALIAFEADTLNLRPDQPHEGRLRISANGGQVLTLFVRVESHEEVESAQSVSKPGWRGIVYRMALTALAVRLLLAVPLDIYARWLSTDPGLPLPGSVAAWAQPPRVDAAFVRLMVLTTGWLGVVAGGWLSWRRSKRLADVLSGIFAGGIAGSLASATLACLWPLIDFAPRWLWRSALASGLQRLAIPPVLATALWIIVAGATWALFGGIVGVWLQRRQTSPPKT